MKFKKLLALCLSVGMIVSLAACGNQEKPVESSQESSAATQSSENVEASTSEAASSEVVEDKGITFPLDEKITFTMMNRYDGENSLADMANMQLIAENTNVYFEHIEYPKAELTEKFNLLFSSDQYGDLLFKTTTYMDFNALGQEGYLIPLEDLIREYMPNLTALMDERELWSTLAASDGHIYCFPQIGEQGVLGMWYNTTWMEQVGIENAPANMDELTDMLRAFKEADLNGNGDANDEIPLLLNTHNDCNWTALQRYMTDHYRTTNTNDELVVLMAEGEYKDQYVYYPRTEEFKENLLKYLVTWYEEGLVNQDMFTIGYDECCNIGMSSNIYGMVFVSKPTATVPEANVADYHYFRPFEKGYLSMGKGYIAGCMSITDKCEYPEILAAWCDQFYTAEGANLLQLGIEGVDYEITSTGGYKKLDAFNTPSGNGNLPNNAQLLVPADLGEATYINTEGAEVAREYGILALEYKFNDEQQTRLADLQNNINGYMRNYVAQVVVGEISLDDTWADFQETLKEMGVEELETLYKAGFEAAK